jgi:hypothetical protein
MSNSIIFFTHIPKCGGGGIEYIFQNLGYKIIYLCNKYHGHQDNINKNYLITLNGNNNYIECNEAYKNISNRSNEINFLRHHTFPGKKQKFNIIIASIRNPYDWMVSRWKYHDKYFPKEYSFNEWVMKFSGEMTMRFIECCYEYGNINNKMIVDYFIRLEYIEQDINNLIKFDILNTKYHQNDIKKFINLKKNTTFHKHYTNYYTEDLKNIVYKSNKLIFDLFKYNYD